MKRKNTCFSAFADAYTRVLLLEMEFARLSSSSYLIPDSILRPIFHYSDTTGIIIQYVQTFLTLNIHDVASFYFYDRKNMNSFIKNLLHQKKRSIIKYPFQQTKEESCHRIPLVWRHNISRILLRGKYLFVSARLRQASATAASRCALLEKFPFLFYQHMCFMYECDAFY